jgi:hypothetical protein
MNNKKNPFSITADEYEMLDKKFGNLSNFQAWQLLKKNTKNNHTNEFEDIIQELRMHLIIAGAYYKRQVYIEKCLIIARKYAKDPFIKNILDELNSLWKNRKRHGANRQKFGPYQEKILNNIVKMIVPPKERPSKKTPLKLDSKFSTYCKAIAWNCQKNLGKKITKEKSIRTGLTSLSEFDYLGSCQT